MSVSPDEELDLRIDGMWKSLTQSMGQQPALECLQAWTAGIMLMDAATEKYGYDKKPPDAGLFRVGQYVSTAARTARYGNDRENPEDWDDIYQFH